MRLSTLIMILLVISLGQLTAEVASNPDSGDFDWEAVVGHQRLCRGSDGEQWPNILPQDAVESTRCVIKIFRNEDLTATQRIGHVYSRMIRVADSFAINTISRDEFIEEMSCAKDVIDTYTAHVRGWSVPSDEDNITRRHCTNWLVKLQ